MMHLELNDEEQKVLADALDSNLLSLSDEIVHTDTREYRDYLVGRRELLARIRTLLH